MKIVLAIVVGGFLALTWIAWAGQQGDIFNTLHCGACHKAERSTKALPSLKEIAKAYEGKEAQLAAYFQGKGRSLVRPDDASRMGKYIEKTKALSDADRKELVDFIMRHKG
ncbi:MAG: c-type cytochrome [Deltaproteobacteria bacterium]|nr:c-type cytochrome [Deltaproteobacteria bacterium]